MGRRAHACVRCCLRHLLLWPSGPASTSRPLAGCPPWAGSAGAGGMGVQTQFSWGPLSRADRGGGAGAGAQLREAAGGRGEGQASLEGEDLPGGRKGPSPGGALPLGIPHPGCRRVNWVPLSLLLTLEHDQQSGFPAPLLPQGQALSCHLACPQSLRGNADKARAGAQRERKLCTGNYTQECQKTPRPALHHGEAPFRFHMPVRTWRCPSGLPLAAGRGP